MRCQAQVLLRGQDEGRQCGRPSSLSFPLTKQSMGQDGTLVSRCVFAPARDVLRQRRIRYAPGVVTYCVNFAGQAMTTSIPTRWHHFCMDKNDLGPCRRYNASSNHEGSVMAPVESVGVLQRMTTRTWSNPWPPDWACEDEVTTAESTRDGLTSSDQSPRILVSDPSMPAQDGCYPV